MAYHGVLVQNDVAAKSVSSYNRSAVASADLDNGSIFKLAAYSTDAGFEEVWTTVQPATGGLSNLWMAYEPELVTIVAGTNQYRGLDQDPRNFYNIAGAPFSCFKPEIGDIITLNAEALAGTKSTNTYVVATDGADKLTWASAAVSGLSLHLIETTTISIGTGAIGSQRVTAYKFEVVAVA